MPRKMTNEEKEYQRLHPDALFCLDESLTKQEFKEECDVDEILRRASNGQDLSAVLNSRVAQYGDFTNIPDFRESMDIIARANSMFMQLDWKLRERFGNDPARMMDFLQDEANLDEARKLGLVKPEAKPIGAAVEPAATGSKPTGDAPAAQ